MLPLMFLGACISKQLSSGTVDVASVIANIEQRQTLQNFSVFAESPYAVPSQAFLTSGTVQVLDSVTPQISFPFSSMLQHTVTYSGTASIADETTTPGLSGQIQGNVAYQDNLQILPLTDPFSLRNLAALYRAVEDNAKFGLRGERGQLNNNGLQLYQVPRMYGREDNLEPDPYYLLYSNCVFCLQETDIPPTTNADLLRRTGTKDGDIVVNDALAYQWLFYESLHDPAAGFWPKDAGPVAKEDLDSIGKANGYRFFVKKVIQGKNGLLTGKQLLASFILLTLPTNNEPPRFASIIKSAVKAGKKRPAPADFTTREFIPYGRSEGQIVPLAPFPSPGIQPQN